VSNPKGRAKLSVYWACSCGGCEIALVNLHEKLLEVDRHFELVFCPCLMDTKAEAVAAMPDGSIAITLFNGGIRTEENLEMARLMRRKSAVLLAYGACAIAGGIPALANLTAGEARMRGIFVDAPSNDNPRCVIPATRVSVPEGELELPAMLDRVRGLGEVVDVDYWIPGCPPEPRQIWSVLAALFAGGPLPPKGSVLGAGVSSVCDECAREKHDKRIAGFVRGYEVEPDPSLCLLEQGLVCMGAATRDGCGALCPKVNIPCAGCYGASAGAIDQGAKMIAALGSALEADMGAIADPAGTFYRYSMSRVPARSDA
jgi:F420-non-reducing hydrogenase small subunit